MAQDNNSFVPSAVLDFKQVIDTPSSTLDFGAAQSGSSTVNITGQAVIGVTASGHVIGYLPAASLSGNIAYALNATASGTISHDVNMVRDLTVSFDSKSDSAAWLASAINNDVSFAEYADYLIDGAYESAQTQQTLANTDSQVMLGISTSGTDNREIAQYLQNVSYASRTNLAYESAQATNNREVAQHIDVTGLSSIDVAKLINTNVLTYSDFAQAIDGHWATGVEFAKLALRAFAINSEFAKIVPCGTRQIIIIDNYQESATLEFTCLWYGQQTQLNFGAICQYQYEPSRQYDGVIFVTNNVSLVRTDNGQNITMFGCSVSIDNNSYAWSFSASVPYTELAKVDIFSEPQINVDLTINSQLWRFILDGCNDGWTFGERTLNIKGKSRAMLLANPYSEHRGYKFTEALTSRQIAEAELNRDNVPSGFSLDWQLVDALGWSVPANTYSYTGRTPINSLTLIAEAAGGFINAHAWDDVIKVLPNYPIPSWQWASATPSINIPSSLIFDISRERVQKPNYNGVLVAGERDGSVMGLIKRTGTSGGYQPPMVTHDLITDESVARAKGLAVLSDTGDIGNISMTTPLHSDIGVLNPSTLVGVTDSSTWVGMVRGTSITCRVGGRGDLDIIQTLNIERHFDKG